MQAADAWSLELEAVLDRYDDKLRAIEQRKQQAENDIRLFFDEFARLRREVIRPVFEAAGAVLERRGHTFCITEQEYVLEAAGKATESSIAIQITPAAAGGAESADRVASLSFQTRHYTKSVCIAGRNEVPAANGAAGPRGDYKLAQIDAQFVQRELLKLLEALIGR